jgi:hypothetical protein
MKQFGSQLEKTVEKLRDAVSGQLGNERDVVYVLCQSRKLLEAGPPKPTLFALKLYCHWALHVDLKYAGTTFEFLSRVEEFVTGVLAGKPDVLQEHRMLREFVFLDTFRQKLKELLCAYALPTHIVDEDKRWHEFLKIYAGVIEDVSLSCEAKTRRLHVVKKVVFSRGRATGAGAYFPFYLDWAIVLKNGRIVTVEVGAQPMPGGEMILHGIGIQ